MKCISVPHIQMEAGVSNSTEPVFSAQHVERFVGGEESYLFFCDAGKAVFFFLSWSLCIVQRDL